MEPDTVAAVISEIRRLWPMANDPEITLEANPSSVEADKFAAFRNGGVNRVSLGIQALDDDDLARLGRLHSVAEAMDALDIAKNTFDRVSFDLIYARQHQTTEAWKEELSRALTLGTDHISLYQLTIEDGTAFGDRYKRGKLAGLPNDDTGADMYEATQMICDAAGMSAYEVSNHAKPDAQSRHNLIYWRYGDYLGIGPGAHGRLTFDGTRWATEAPRNPEAWLRLTESEQHGFTKQALSTDDQATEFLLMGLRLYEGVDMARFAQIAGHDIDPSKLDQLLDLGMIHIDGQRLIVSKQGFNILNAVIEALLPD